MPAGATDPAQALYIGCMSGTSMDGLDCVAVHFPSEGQLPDVLAHGHSPYPGELVDALRRAALEETTTLDQACLLDGRLGDFYAQRIDHFIREHALPRNSIAAIGLHGQTLRHAPDGNPGYSLQIGDAHRVAAGCGIPVISDFRRRDIALGGQGAPLTPAFHAAAFRHPQVDRVILNIGGITNLTWLPADPGQPVTGFDSGPGNCLLDHLARHHLGTAFDDQGKTAAGGRASTEILERLWRDEPYFRQAPPKSTGTDYFSPAWLERQSLGKLSIEDLFATVGELTVMSIVRAIDQLPARPTELLVCGGGARNRWLMERLQAELPDIRVADTSTLGMDPQQVEAIAFAWLARQYLLGKPGNLPSVTRARSAAVLGCLHSGNEKTAPLC